MSFFKSILPAFIFIILAGCQSQREKVKVNTTIPLTHTSFEATSDILEKPQSFFATVNGDDIGDALELLGINIYSIKLPVVNSKKYKLVVYTDNYIQNKETVKKKNEFLIINEKHESPKNLSLTIIKTGDSSLVIKWKAPDGSTRSFENPRGRLSGFEYRVLPFQFQEIIPGKKIPILLLGSSWFDARVNGIRFCSDLEINPDLKDDAFEKMPQYYIFSIELSENIQ